jgi:hypothetical protein
MSLPQQLVDSRYIATTKPTWIVELLDTGTIYNFEDFSSFDAAQQTCGGSRLHPTFEGCLEFMVARHERLTKENAEESSFPWCSSGIWRGADGLNWVAWYATTSCTHFMVGEVGGSLCLSAHLPEGRGDNHRKKLVAAQKGRTLEMYKRWYNAYFLDSEEREKAYAEQSAWWNEHMTSNFLPLATVEQLKLSRQIDRVIGAFYGDWNSVGDTIKTALGSSAIDNMWMRPQEIDPEKVKEMWDYIEFYLRRSIDRLEEARKVHK